MSRVTLSITRLFLIRQISECYGYKSISNRITLAYPTLENCHYWGLVLRKTTKSPSVPIHLSFFSYPKRSSISQNKSELHLQAYQPGITCTKAAGTNAFQFLAREIKKISWARKIRGHGETVGEPVCLNLATATSRPIISSCCLLRRRGWAAACLHNLDSIFSTLILHDCGKS